MSSVALICTAADRDQANLLAATMGYGPNNFGVELSASGKAPATHYGGYAMGGVGESFILVVKAAQMGQLPPVDWPKELPETDVLPLFSRLEIIFNTAWETAISSLSLILIEVEMEPI